MKKYYSLLVSTLSIGFFCIANLAQAGIPANYIFTQISGTYVPLIGGTVLANPGTGTAYTNLPIGFDFVYNNTVYTSFSVHSTGYLVMGSSLTFAANPMADPGTQNAICVLAGGNIRPSTSGAGGELSYLTSGNPGARTLTVQWRAFAKDPAADNFDIQLRLNETSNTIEISYGSFVYSGALTSSQYFVGLKGGNENDFNTRFVDTDWLVSSRTTSSAQRCVLKSDIVPPSGLIFAWEPPQAAPMNFVSSTCTTPTLANISKASVNNPMVRVKVTTEGGSLAAFSLTSMRIRSYGSTDFANDVSTVKVYYTGAVTSFINPVLFGSTSSLDNPINGNQSLQEGENYFWITYDVPATASVDHYLDAECAELQFSGPTGTKIPDITAPDGSRIIRYCSSLSNGSSFRDNIGAMSFGSFSNGDTDPAFFNSRAVNHYTDHTQLTPAIFHKGSSYPFFLRKTTAGASHDLDHLTVFIDYNADGRFDPSTEQAYSQSMPAATATASGNISIPATASTGTTRVRVILRYFGSTNENPCIVYNWGETEDFTINIQEPVSCSIPLQGGKTKINHDSLCANTPFNLYLDQASKGSDLSYQWESSNDEQTWSPIAGATTPFYTRQQSATTFYRAKITCGTTTATSYRVKAITRLVNCYCSSRSTAASGGRINIGRVIFGSMSNGNPNPLPPASNGQADKNYTDFTSIVAAQEYRQQSSYPISVSVIYNSGSNFTGSINVFIDYDQNGLLDPATERVFSGTASNTASTHTASGNIIIPSAAKLGNTLMRAIFTRNGNNMVSPCGTYGEGETEDYVIRILPPLYVKDMRAVRLLTPGNTSCFSNSEKVTLEIKNEGSAQIDFSNDPLTITAGVTGTNPANFPPVILNTGTLAPGASQQVLITNNYDISQPGEYSFNASLSISGDGFSGNNSIEPSSIDNRPSGGVISSNAYRICFGNNVTLNSKGTNGTLQWQRYNTALSTWEDESGPGSNSTSLVVQPQISTTYRLLSCNQFASNSIHIHVSPLPNFHYAQAAYCQNVTDPAPIFQENSNAGIFAASPSGLRIDTYTGIINLSASTPGIYRITNTLGAAGGCPALTEDTVVEVRTADDPSFHYLDSVYCQQAANPSPRITGLTGGVFSATPTGLNINSANGLIDLSLSSNNSYIVSYTSRGNCPAIATAPIRITNEISANFVYAQDPYCQNEANPSPSFSGIEVAGVFSASPAGLVINDQTGLVDLSASTAGTYTVTNSVSPRGICAGSSASKSIQISAAATAGFRYSGNPYCQSTGAANPAPVLDPGAQAGIFASDPGVVIDPATGMVNIAASTPGTYTVSNTVAASGGCPAVTAYAGITITAFANCPTAGGTSISGTINHYRAVTAVGCNRVTLANASGFHAGDRAMLIQMKGLRIDLSNSNLYGTILDYKEAGNYELVTISHLAGNQVFFTYDLLREYDPAGLVQLVRIPVYQNVTITGTLTAQPWNGSVGGIIALEASGTITMAANIDASAVGFKGGSLILSGTTCSQTSYATAAGFNARKGEGAAAFLAPFDAARGPLSNGGGGANGNNSGGGGGGNVGKGGNGGNQVETCPASANGGIGGLNLPYNNSMNKVFMGGGGGAGHQDGILGSAPLGSAGTNGGGIIWIKAGSISGNGYAILANGANNTEVAQQDGAGGAGAGGSILLNAPTFNSLTVLANGGFGGNTAYTHVPHGPGGGGAGGVIWVSSTLTGITPSVLGGAAGFSLNANTGVNTNHGALAGEAGSTLTGLAIPERISALTASISYEDGNFCDAENNPIPNIVGPLGGSFTAHPTGLVFKDPLTGEIDLKNSRPNTYTILYTGPGKCPVSAETTISIRAAQKATFLYENIRYCSEDSDPSPIFTNGGIAGNFSSGAGLNINPSTGKIDLSTSTIGTYTVTNTLAANAQCPQVQENVTVEIFGAQNADFSYPTTSYCQSASPARPQLASSSGTGTFSASPAGLVFIDTQTGEIDFANSLANTYTIRHTLPNPCGAFLEKTLTITATPLAGFRYAKDSYCQLENNPVIVLDPGASTGIFSSTAGLSIEPSTGTINLSSSSTGNFVITNTIAATTACPQQSATFTINIIDQQNSSFNYNSTVFCKTGNNPSAIISGDPGGVFTANPAGLVFSNTATGTIDLAASTINTYTVQYTLSGQCGSSTNRTIQLIEQPDPRFSYSASEYCQNNGLINPSFPLGATAGSFSAEVGLSIHANTGVIDLNSSSSGSYTIVNTVSAANGCPTVTHRVALTVRESPTISNISNQQSICSEDIHQINFSSNQSGTLFSWMANSSSPAISGFSSSGTGDMLQDQPKVSGTTAGVITYRVTPSNAYCTGPFKDFETTVNPIPQLVANPTTSTICSGSQIVIPLSSNVSGSTFDWTWSADAGVSGGSNGSGTIIQQTLTYSGTQDAQARYSISANKEGCSSPAQIVSISVNPLPDVVVDPLDQEICSGEQANIRLSSSVAGSSFSWVAIAHPDISGSNNGSGSAILQLLNNSNSSPAIQEYRINAEKASCVGPVQTARVTVKPLPVLLTSPSNTPGNPDTTICINTSAMLTAFGADSYDWEPAALLQQNSGSSVLTQPLAEGLYSFTVIGSLNGCSASKGLQVMALSQIPAPTVSGNQHICKGEGVELTAMTSISPAKFFWYKDAALSEIIIDQATLKTDPLFSDDTTFYTNIYYGDCASGLTNFYIKIRTLPQIQIIGETTVCQGNSFSIRATGGDSYRWFKGIDTLSTDPQLDVVPLQDGDWYYILVKDSACASLDSIKAIVNPLPPIDLEDEEIGLCLGDSRKIGTPAQSGVSYRWQPKLQLNNDTIAQPTLRAKTLGPITYTLTGTYSTTGCQKSKTLLAQVYAIPKPEILVPELYSKNPPCSGERLTLQASGSLNPGYRYLWQAPNGVDGNQAQYSIILAQEPLDYTLELTSDQGCKALAMVSLEGANCSDIGAHVPDIFSPNQDDVNETLQVRYGAGILSARMYIFDRWGGLVYSGDKEDKPWNGTKGSDSMPDGVYVYLLELQTKAGTNKRQQGLVTLIR